MHLAKTHGYGGTFDSTIQIMPIFRFTEVSNPAHIIEQPGPAFGWQDFLTGPAAPWQSLVPELDCPDCATGFTPGFDEGVKTPFTLYGNLIHLTLEPSCPNAIPQTSDVAAGVDILKCSGTAEFEFGLGCPAIPADFFAPGSEPFTGRVDFASAPLGSNPGCAGPLGPTDTLIRRLGPAPLPLPGSTATIPIEIIALHLQSVHPIQVAGSPKADAFFDVFLETSTSLVSSGSMTIRRDDQFGGSFDAELYVAPKFIFREVGNPSKTIEWDAGGFRQHLRTTSVPWINDALGLGWPACSSNFAEGVHHQAKSIVDQKSTFSFAGVGASLPLEPVDFSMDSDGDGLTDFEEEALGMNPLAYDTDADGLPDGWEVQNALGPNDASGPNGGSGDIDGDGVSNHFEYLNGTDPQDPDSAPALPISAIPAMVGAFLGVFLFILRRSRRA